MSQQAPAANRMTLQLFKGRLTGANKGHKLLKKKRDALKKEFEGTVREVSTAKYTVDVALKDAGFAYAKANWATPGDFSLSVLESAKIPSVTCKLSSKNVAGVKLPEFSKVHDATYDAKMQTLGVACGGAVIQACQKVYRDSLSALIVLASLQTKFFTLDEEIKMTGRRVNALEYVVIPKIEKTMKYIEMEMDEQAREEFFRIKKVVQKKKQKIEKAKKALAAQAAPNANSNSALDDQDDDKLY